MKLKAKEAGVGGKLFAPELISNWLITKTMPIIPDSSKVIVLLLPLILILPGCLNTGPTNAESAFHGTEMDANMWAPLFTLQDQNEELWSLEDYRGKTVIMSFIYTRCIDTCPVISASLTSVREKLSQDELNNTEWVSITIDPWYDSPSVLQNWTSDRGYNWTHLTGVDTAVTPILDSYGVAPISYEDNSSEGYGFSHTQPTYIIDETGHFQVVWSEEDIPIDLFVEDIRVLLVQME